MERELRAGIESLHKMKTDSLYLKEYSAKQLGQLPLNTPNVWRGTMQFVAIDVETANQDMASICSIGAAKFENGEVIDEWYSLIDPQDYFSGFNTAIHGITEEMVRGMPVFQQGLMHLQDFVGEAVVVTHTHFDRVAIHQSANKSRVVPPAWTWLDSARVARRTWADCAYSGYGLADVCRRIGYKFQHHNALEDAKAAGYIMLAAIELTGLELSQWEARVLQPIDPSAVSSGAAIRRNGNQHGPLSGEVIVFTGALTMVRSEAADIAASVGCDVHSNVTKMTTILVVGGMDVQRLAGHEKSSKHRKAEELARSGQPIRIIRETDFRELITLS